MSAGYFQSSFFMKHAKLVTLDVALARSRSPIHYLAPKSFGSSPPLSPVWSGQTFFLEGDTGLPCS